MKLYCLTYAQSVLNEDQIFEGGSKKRSLPIAFASYLIQTKNKIILIDAGCDTMPGFEMDYLYPIEKVLVEIGLSTKEITDLIITHAHHDHIDGVRHFPKALIHLSKEAFEKGQKYIPDGFETSLFEGEKRLTQKVKIIEWGGHARGSCIVEIQESSAIHIIAGDECYTAANIQEKRPTGCFFDEEKAQKFIEIFGQAPYIVHTCHDISLKTERIF